MNHSFHDLVGSKKLPSLETKIDMMTFLQKKKKKYSQKLQAQMVMVP